MGLILRYFVKNEYLVFKKNANPQLGDIRRHVEAPLFIKNLLECQKLHFEVVKGEDQDPTNQKALLGDSPASWILSIAQRFVVDYFVSRGAHYVLLRGRMLFSF